MMDVVMAGLMTPDGKIDPIGLRSIARLAAPKIDAMAKNGDAPGYVISSVRGMVAAIERWGLETENARREANSVPTP